MRTCSRGQQLPRWDRILDRIGTRGIPAPMGGKGNKERPAKSSRAIFAFYSPGPPLGRLTKEMGLFDARRTWPMELNRFAVLQGWMRAPPAGHRRTGGVCSRFLRSHLRRIGLGHPLGRDPLRTSMPATKLTTAANSSDHRPARSNPAGRLQ